MMKITLGPIGMLVLLIICIVLALVYGISILIGVGLVVITLVVAEPNHISNYKSIWFWMFLLGVGLVILSALGFGFQMVGNELMWVSPI